MRVRKSTGKIDIRRCVNQIRGFRRTRAKARDKFRNTVIDAYCNSKSNLQPDAFGQQICNRRTFNDLVPRQWTDAVCITT